MPKNGNRNRKRPKPLAVQPVMMKSRKKARKITSRFHKLMVSEKREIETEKRDGGPT